MTSVVPKPIAIVGLNYGRWILKALADHNGAGRYFRLAALSDLNSERAHAMAAIHSAPIRTLDEILADPDIPAVGLFVGPAGRAELIHKIIQAGKHVMTTKPFELDAQKAIHVLGEAQRLQRVVHLNSPGPQMPPDLATIERWRKQYNLGRPISCRADTYISYNETADGSWYDDSDRCPVAPIFRIGIYLINDLVHLFGEAKAVQVMTSRMRTGRPTPDTAQIGIQFKNGALANVFASFCIDDGQRWTDTLTLNFERGTIYRNVGPLLFGGGPEGTTTLQLLTSDNKKPIIQKLQHPTRSGAYQWEAFYRAIDGELIETPIAPLAAGLRIVAAMARAEKNGQTELIPACTGISEFSAATLCQQIA